MKMTQHLLRAGLATGVYAIALVGSASALQLSNGPGDGSVSVGVDGYGSFGSAVGGDGTSDAVFDPMGPLEPAGTTFESAVFLSGPPSFLSSGDIGGSGSLPAPAFSIVTDTSAASNFTRGSLDFVLTQTLTQSLDDGGNRVGTLFSQQYLVTNTADVSNSFSLTRYIDGDLLFDGTISDGGGLIELGGNQVLFETDAADDPNQPATFVGITAIGGDASLPNRYEASSFSGLRSTIISGGNLNDMIEGDTDGDDFVDNAYDVTLAFRNDFTLGPNETGTYLTQTIFGNAVPPKPGSSETLPLLPDSDEPPFVFDVTIEDPDERLWIDPDVATGYDLEIDGLLFASVQMPSFDTVPDPDGYDILVREDESLISVASLLPGEELVFDTPVDFFRIDGINVELMIDPLNPLGFPVGLTFDRAGRMLTTMTPLVTQVPHGMPAPGTLALLVVGLLGFRSLVRRGIV